jgi:hypothetical protein
MDLDTHVENHRLDKLAAKGRTAEVDHNEEKIK